jgi:EAL domain-containing protein (putative c-di-GMP-specific phosphodiesterase class I)
LEIRFQPIIDIDTETVVCVETFCTLNVAVQGIEGTAAFVKHAEASGLIRGLTESVLDLALGEWEKLTDGPSVAVNVSHANLEEADFVDRVEAALERHGIEGTSVTLELPEGIQLIEDGPSLDMIRRLGSRGVRISVDGFGPEHSMFSYIELERIGTHEVKIDASFLENLGVGRRATLKSMVEVCRRGRMDAVIKNVETSEQLEMARELGCNQAQGYLIARPMDAGALEAWLQGRKVVLATRRQAQEPEVEPSPAPERRSVFDKLLRRH